MAKQPTRSPLQTFLSNYDPKQSKSDDLVKSVNSLHLIQAVLEKRDKVAAEKVLGHLFGRLGQNCDFAEIGKYLVENGLFDPTAEERAQEVEDEAAEWLKKAVKASKEILPTFEEEQALRRQNVERNVAKSSFQTKYLFTGTHTLYLRSDIRKIAIWDKETGREIWYGDFLKVPVEIGRAVGISVSYVDAQTQ